MADVNSNGSAGNPNANQAKTPEQLRLEALEAEMRKRARELEELAK